MTKLLSVYSATVRITSSRERAGSSSEENCAAASWTNGFTVPAEWDNILTIGSGGRVVRNSRTSSGNDAGSGSVRRGMTCSSRFSGSRPGRR
ncbi:hypothetical protein [Nonomuraea rubra]|uniref:hypothetical protein n=1 Tax=Nonomuraea rubra TaxID=46180 RepID=UPI003620B816